MSISEERLWFRVAAKHDTELVWVDADADLVFPLAGGCTVTGNGIFSIVRILLIEYGRLGAGKRGRWMMDSVSLKGMMLRNATTSRGITRSSLQVIG